MLPDFPVQKKKLAENYIKIFQKTLVSESITSRSPHLPINEGIKNSILRENGSYKEESLKRHEAKMEINLELLSSLTPQALMEKYKQLARDMACEQMKTMLNGLNCACDESGQTVNGKGGKFSIELWFQMMNKMELQFDENGNQKEMICLIHPSMEDGVKSELQRVENEPELKRRYEELVSRKRREWCDKEAARKLVG